MIKKILFLALVATMFSCSKDNRGGSGGGPSSTVDPSDPDALSSVLIFPAGSESSEGNPPPPSQDEESPIVESQLFDITSSNGSTAPLRFSYDNITDNIGGCYVQIDGAGNFFTIPYDVSSGTSGELQLPVGIPTNVSEGDFTVNFCIYDNNGLVSNVISTNISVLSLGTGAVQISLSWNTATDQDLYVTDPFGEEISYMNESSESGGQLDRDDTEGYGPENIFWSESAPDGEYSVSVNDFEETDTPNVYYVTISGPNNQTRSYSGTTQNGSTVLVTTFTKNGDQLNF